MVEETNTLRSREARIDCRRTAARLSAPFIGCMKSSRCDLVKFKPDFGGEKELYFLLDTGAHVSIIKSKKSNW